MGRDSNLIKKQLMMKAILFTSRIPHNHSHDVMSQRYTNFGLEMDFIFDKYQKADTKLQRPLNIPFDYDVLADTVTMHEFSQDSNIPKAMQNDIVASWSKIWAH
jgi:hypothetical protein